MWFSCVNSYRRASHCTICTGHSDADGEPTAHFPVCESQI